MTNRDPLLTIGEVAERLRTPQATLRYWRHMGTGPRAARLGRNLVYRESDVEAWLEAQFAKGVGDDLDEAAGA